MSSLLIIFSIVNAKQQVRWFKRSKMGEWKLRHMQNWGIIFDQKQPSQRCSIKKCVLKSFAKFTGKRLCQSLFLTKAESFNFIKKETLAQMLSCEYCEFFKNTFFTEYLSGRLLLFDQVCKEARVYFKQSMRVCNVPEYKFSFVLIFPL